jgi:hypothetical protein
VQEFNRSYRKAVNQHLTIKKSARHMGYFISNDRQSRRKPSSLYRKFRRKLSKTKLRIPHIWLRHRGLKPSDIFIASYPRSGVTWTRFTLFEILTGRSAGFDKVNTGIPGVGRHQTALSLFPGGRRLIGTHEQYRSEYKRAIYLVRDPRDVALSEFAYTRALDFFRGDFDEFLEIFLRGRISGFGPWPKHVTSWLDSPIAGTEGLLLVRYEDLRQHPFEEFTRILSFLGIDVGAQRIHEAIDNNNLDRMREKEQIEPQKASVKSRFVRSGSVQGWPSMFTASQEAFFVEHARSALLRLDYVLKYQAGRVTPLVASSFPPPPVAL